MNGLRLDVASLDNYEVHLSDKVQLLLDAMVGLIGIAQNDIFRFLTVLMASIYGMNFNFMPEDHWAFG
ncbi:CorA family divalent cation transporter [Mesorhizobium sp. M0965]|uniref:CorA family divalent cation transporter n=1 Tax=unclassified Mesorhizobium TaxID=325217 RepID=UPI00333B27B1